MSASLSGDLLRDEIRARTLEDGRDAIDELARHCECYAIVDSASGILQPHYCRRHAIEASAARIAFGYVKYERCFLSEADARDRAHIVKSLYRCDDTQVEVVPVGRYWIVLARWGFTTVGQWNQP